MERHHKEALLKKQTAMALNGNRLAIKVYPQN